MTIVSGGFKKLAWPMVLLFTLIFWMSSSLLLDIVVMPVLYSSGMMVEPGFATTGYAMFWVFNRVELLCAALVLTSALVLRQTGTTASGIPQQSIVFASLLMVVALICTYGLAPQMSGLGLQLNLFKSVAETPTLMASLHASYWVLELTKLGLGTALLRQSWRSMAEAV